jgi:hypothetical protein
METARQRTRRISLILGTLVLVAAVWSPGSSASAATTHASATFDSDWVMEDGVSQLDTGEIWQRDKNIFDLYDGQHVSSENGLNYTGCGSGWTWFPVAGKVQKVDATYSLNPPIQPRAWPQWPWTVHAIYWLTLHPVQSDEIKPLLYSPPWMWVRAGPTLLDVGIVVRGEAKILYRVDFDKPFLPFETPLRAGLERVGYNAVKVTLPGYPYRVKFGSGPVVRHWQINKIFTKNMSVEWDFDIPCTSYTSNIHPTLHSIDAEYTPNG